MQKSLKINSGSYTLIYATKILVIDPGSKAIGTAYFDNGDLVLSAEIKSHSKDYTKRLDNLVTRIYETYLEYEIDLIVLEFGGSIRLKGRDPHGIRKHDFAAGYIGASLSDFFQKNIVLIPPKTWKGNTSRKKIIWNAQMIHGQKFGEDEAHAVGLGAWYINQLKLFKQVI